MPSTLYLSTFIFILPTNVTHHPHPACRSVARVLIVCPVLPRRPALVCCCSGRSLGTATVVFNARDDALAAFNRYNNVALDNKRMAIEVVEQAVPRGTFKTLSSGIKYVNFGMVTVVPLACMLALASY